MTDLARTLLTTACAAAALAATSPAHAESTLDLAGLSVTADWQRVGYKRHEATGSASLGPVRLADADLFIDRRSAHRALTGTGDLMLELFDGCRLAAPSASLGYATGADIKDDVGGDAPVQDDASYLYVAGGDGTTLDCLGFEIELAGGDAAEIYINPDDPSLFVRSTGFGDALGASPAIAAAMQAAKFEISDAWIGLSANGLVPWQADYPVNGQPPAFDAHVVVGGTFEVMTSLGPVEVEDGSLALALGAHGLRDFGASGAVAMPLIRTMVGNVELPLAEGAMRARPDGRIDFEITSGGSPFDELAVPDAVAGLLDSAVSGQTGNLRGHFYAAGQGSWGIEIGMGGSGALGPFVSDDVRVELNTSGLAFRGEADFGFAGMNLAGATLEGAVMGPMFHFTLAGEADLPVDGADMDVDLTWGPWGLVGGAEARVWGVKVDGDFEFAGTRFEQLDLTHKVKFWFGKVKLKVKVRRTSISVRAICDVAGYKFDVGVSSNGCFRGKGMNLCF